MPCGLHRSRRGLRWGWVPGGDLQGFPVGSGASPLQHGLPAWPDTWGAPACGASRVQIPLPSTVMGAQQRSLYSHPPASSPGCNVSTTPQHQGEQTLPLPPLSEKLLWWAGDWAICLLAHLPPSLPVPATGVGARFTGTRATGAGSPGEGRGTLPKMRLQLP